MKREQLKTVLYQVRQCAKRENQPVAAVLIKALAGIEINDKEIASYELKSERDRRKFRNRLEEIRQLSTLLPFCPCCDKVKSDPEYWKRLETCGRRRFAEVFEASQTALCRECAERLGTAPRPGA